MMPRNPEFDTQGQRLVRSARKWAPRLALALAIPAALAVCYAFPLVGVLLTLTLGGCAMWLIKPPTEEPTP